MSNAVRSAGSHRSVDAASSRGVAVSAGVSAADGEFANAMTLAIGAGDGTGAAPQGGGDGAGIAHGGRKHGGEPATALASDTTSDAADTDTVPIGSGADLANLSAPATPVVSLLDSDAVVSLPTKTGSATVAQSIATDAATPQPAGVRLPADLNAVAPMVRRGERHSAVDQTSVPPASGAWALSAIATSSLPVKVPKNGAPVAPTVAAPSPVSRDGRPDAAVTPAVPPVSGAPAPIVGAPGVPAPATQLASGAPTTASIAKTPVAHNGKSHRHADMATAPSSTDVSTAPSAIAAVSLLATPASPSVAVGSTSTPPPTTDNRHRSTDTSVSPPVSGAPIAPANNVTPAAPPTSGSNNVAPSVAAAPATLGQAAAMLAMESPTGNAPAAPLSRMEVVARLGIGNRRAGADTPGASGPPSTTRPADTVFTRATPAATVADPAQSLPAVSDRTDTAVPSAHVAAMDDHDPPTASVATAAVAQSLAAASQYSAAPSVAPTTIAPPADHRDNAVPATAPAMASAIQPAIANMVIASSESAPVSGGRNRQSIDAAAMIDSSGATGSSATTQSAPIAAASAGSSDAGASGTSQSFVDALANHVMTLVSNGHQEATLQLQPPQLGDLTVRIAVQGRDVSAWFGAAQPQVQQAVSQALDQLRTDLAGAGFNLSGAWVGADTSGMQQQRQFESSSPSARRPSFAASSIAAARDAGEAAPRQAGVNIYV